MSEAFWSSNMFMTTFLRRFIDEELLNRGLAQSWYLPKKVEQDDGYFMANNKHYIVMERGRDSRREIETERVYSVS